MNRFDRLLIHVCPEIALNIMDQPAFIVLQDSYTDSRSGLYRYGCDSTVSGERTRSVGYGS